MHRKHAYEHNLYKRARNEIESSEEKGERKAEILHRAKFSTASYPRIHNYGASSILLVEPNYTLDGYSFSTYARVTVVDYISTICIQTNSRMYEIARRRSQLEIRGESR